MSSLIKNNDKNYDRIQKNILKLAHPSLTLMIWDKNFIRVPFMCGDLYHEAQKHECNFSGLLKEFQTVVAQQALDNLKKDANVLLALFCGAGKTVIILWLVSQLLLPVHVIVPRKILVDQWKLRAKQFCPDIKLTVGLNANGFVRGGILVLDEVHQLFVKSTMEEILACQPRYLIGASATPWRDNDTVIFDHFFKNKLCVLRPPIKCFLKVVYTNLKPPMVTRADGRLDWNQVLNWQATCPERQELIVDYCRRQTEKTLILTKRIDQAKTIVALLGYEASLFVGSMNTSQLNYKKYLVSTFSKLGTGFDDDSLRVLVVASDITEYFEQYAGRILRGNTTAYFYDFVDDNHVLFKHYKIRKIFYDQIEAQRCPSTWSEDD